MPGIGDVKLHFERPFDPRIFRARGKNILDVVDTSAMTQSMALQNLPRYFFRDFQIAVTLLKTP